MAYYLGIMSGTSLDGVDIALVDINKAAQCQFIAAETIPYPELLLDALQAALSQTSITLKVLGELDIRLGQFIAEHIALFLQKQHLSPADITAIGNHGQTLFHSPDNDFAFSLQIGNNNTIAELTGITTIGDLRQRDIAAGGQGAPLVPAFHQQQFSSKKEHRAIVNIGGISNITLLGMDGTSEVLGFDTGPGNGLLNSWIKQHKGDSYDKDGRWAETGICQQHLLAAMLADPYFDQAIPKSTGREYFNLAWVIKHVVNSGTTITPQDVQATLLELTAISITQHIEQYCQHTRAIFICGGGGHNPALMKRIKELNKQRNVTTTDEIGLNPDWVEACAFAWLAYQTLNGLSGNLPSVTGAKHPVVLGAIYSSSEIS